MSCVSGVRFLLCRRAIQQFHGLFQPYIARARSTMESPHPPEGFKVIKEGSALLLAPKDTEGTAFYNPAMVTNRDLSVAAVRVFGAQKADQQKKKKRVQKEDSQPPTVPDDKLYVLDALSATGLRALRYTKEAGSVVGRVVANDVDENAVQAIYKHLNFNGIEDRVDVTHSDACDVMYAHKRQHRFDVVDIDPYGSPHPFLDASVQCVKEGGLLCVTATDMAVLCGNYPGTCYGKYGGIPLKGKVCHEMALRLLIGIFPRVANFVDIRSVESAANRYKRHVQPLISLSVDHYIRVFMRIRTSAGATKRSAGQQGLVFKCVGCNGVTTLPFLREDPKRPDNMRLQTTHALGSTTCEACGYSKHIAGPAWLGPIKDESFLQAVVSHLDTHAQEYSSQKRLSGLLHVLNQELNNPFFLDLTEMCNVVHCHVPPYYAVVKALQSSGFNVSRSHTLATALKTNASIDDVWDVVRSWNKIHPSKRVPEGSPARAILDKHPKVDYDWDALQSGGKRDNTQRGAFHPNPEAHWGPQRKPKRPRIDQSDGSDL